MLSLLSWISWNAVNKFVNTYSQTVPSALINALIHSEKEAAATFARSFKALMAWVASVVPGVVLFTMFYMEMI